MGSAGSELVVFGLDLAQVGLSSHLWTHVDALVSWIGSCVCVTCIASSHTTTHTHIKQHRLQEETRLTLPRPGAADVKIRPDEKLFAVGGWDHRVRAFSLGTKKKGGKCTPLAVLQCHAESVQALAFAGAGGMPLASGGKDARIALWDLYPPES